MTLSQKILINLFLFHFISILGFTVNNRNLGFLEVENLGPRPLNSEVVGPPEYFDEIEMMPRSEMVDANDYSPDYISPVNSNNNQSPLSDNSIEFLETLANSCNENLNLCDKVLGILDNELYVNDAGYEPSDFDGNRVARSPESDMIRLHGQSLLVANRIKDNRRRRMYRMKFGKLG